MGRFWFDQARRVVSKALGPLESTTQITKRVLAILAPTRELVLLQSRKVSVSLSRGTWLRALEHVPRERLTETFRLAKAVTKIRDEATYAAYTEALQEPRRSSPLLVRVCFVFFVCCCCSLVALPGSSWFFPRFRSVLRTSLIGLACVGICPTRTSGTGPPQPVLRWPCPRTSA